MDKNHFHREFTNLKILNEESATHFLKRFTMGETKAIIADNSYSEQESVDLFLAALNHTKNMPYLYIIQHYLSKRHNNEEVSFHDIERRVLAADETCERDAFFQRKMQIASGFATTELQHDSEQANTVDSLVILPLNTSNPSVNMPTIHKVIIIKAGNDIVIQNVIKAEVAEAVEILINLNNLQHKLLQFPMQILFMGAVLEL